MILNPTPHKKQKLIKKERKKKGFQNADSAEQVGDYGTLFLDVQVDGTVWLKTNIKLLKRYRSVPTVFKF